MSSFIEWCRRRRPGTYMGRVSCVRLYGHRATRNVLLNDLHFSESLQVSLDPTAACIDPPGHRWHARQCPALTVSVVVLFRLGSPWLESDCAALFWSKKCQMVPDQRRSYPTRSAQIEPAKCDSPQRIYKTTRTNVMGRLGRPCFKRWFSQPFFCFSFFRADIACHQVHLGMLLASSRMCQCPRCFRSGGESMVRNKSPCSALFISLITVLGRIFSFKVGTKIVIGTARTVLAC